MQKTKWKPDTCDCIIEYEWDDLLPVNIREHRAIEATPCDAHKECISVEDIYNKVLEENQRKNGVHQIIMATPGTTVNVMQPDGRTTPVLNPNYTVNYYYDTERLLNVAITGFISMLSQNIQTQVALIYGNTVRFV